MIQPAIIEIDVHGCTVEQALRKIDQTLAKAGKSVYRIRVIHGYNGGTRIRDAIQREMGHGLEPRILRIAPGYNQGISELILREY